MRADRLVHLVLLLQEDRRWTAPALAAVLEVSPRTILRDMDALAVAGLPVYAERGARGGVRLLTGARPNLTRLTARDVRALVLGGHPEALRDLGWHQAQSAGWMKVMTDLTPELRAAAATAERFLVDERPWFSHQDRYPPDPLLVAAVSQGRAVAFCHERGDGTRHHHSGIPVGLVCKVGVWYLVVLRDGAAGADGQGGRVRAYRTTRVHGVELREACPLPPFSLEAFWRDWTRQFEEGLPRYDVVLRVHQDAYPDFELATPWLAVGGRLTVHRQVGHDWLTVSLAFGSAEVACGHVVGFGNRIRVQSPPELAALVRARGLEAAGGTI